MPSKRPARSSADRPAVLVVGLSARALAAAARRAGLRPLAADLFRDRDTRQLAWRSRRVTGSVTNGLEVADLIASLDSLAIEAGGTVMGVVAGAGLEDRVDLLARLDARYGLIGNDPATICRVKHPPEFFALLDRLSIAHPTVTFTTPANRRGWLVKRVAASGGAHVEPLRATTPDVDDHYFQRQVRGRAVSALFLADGQNARVLGYSEQWAAPDGPRTPFRFGGLVHPSGLSADLAKVMALAIERLVPETGLVGLNSADFLVRHRDFDLLEINPRLGASLDIFDRVPGAPLFALHCRASAGEMPEYWTAPPGATASAVVYADRRLVVPTNHRWPAWSADRPERGQVIDRGEPLCSVMASAKTASRARTTAQARAQQILDAMARPPRRRRLGVRPEISAQ